MALTLEAARAALSAAQAKAAELGFARGPAVAITDAAGVLLVLERPTGAALPALVCEAKAATSALTGMPTGGLAGAEERWPKLTNPIAERLGQRFTLYAGGQPIRAGDHVVGAIGVSGGTPEQDDVVAQAAVEAALAALG
jgi:uncharacterized protein GlcG (DUF336 family)